MICFDLSFRVYLEQKSYLTFLLFLLVFGHDQVTTGASADYRQATKLAIEMIKVYGMSEKTGPRAFIFDNDKDEISPQTLEMLDQEIKKTLEDSYSRAKHIIKSHNHELKALAEALLEYETLDSEQIKKVLEGQKL